MKFQMPDGTVDVPITRRAMTRQIPILLGALTGLGLAMNGFAMGKWVLFFLVALMCLLDTLVLSVLTAVVKVAEKRRQEQEAEVERAQVQIRIDTMAEFLSDLQAQRKPEPTKAVNEVELPPEDMPSWTVRWQTETNGIEPRSVTQAAMAKMQNPDTHVFEVTGGGRRFEVDLRHDTVRPLPGPATNLLHLRPPHDA